jgi:cell division GTPase FtsZ
MVIGDILRNSVSVDSILEFQHAETCGFHRLTIGLGDLGIKSVVYMEKIGIPASDFLALMPNNTGNLPLDAHTLRILQQYRMIILVFDPEEATAIQAASCIAAASNELKILTIPILIVPSVYTTGQLTQTVKEEIFKLEDKCALVLLVPSDPPLYEEREFPGLGFLKTIYPVSAIATKALVALSVCQGHMHTDLGDLTAMISDTGSGLVITGEAAGEFRLLDALKSALTSWHVIAEKISKSKIILIYMETGEDNMEIKEIQEMFDYLDGYKIIETDSHWDFGSDSELGEKARITLIGCGVKGGW